MDIIAISGFIGSGKDTVSNYLIKKHGYKKESLASSLKDATAAIFSWERSLLEGDTFESREWRETVDEWWSAKLGIPNFTPRMALQLLGTEVFRDHFHQDIWVLSLEKRLLNSARVVITDCRFPNEVTLINKMGGKLIWVRRGELPQWYSEALKLNFLDPNQIDAFSSKYIVHESEFSWVSSKFDYIIDNNSSMESLHAQIDNIFTIANSVGELPSV